MKHLILTTSMAALLAVASTAVAQTTKGEGGGAPSIEKSRPSGNEGKTAPSPSTPKAQKGASDEKSAAANKSVQKGVDDANKKGGTKATQNENDNKRTGDAKNVGNDQKSQSNADGRDKNDKKGLAASTDKNNGRMGGKDASESTGGAASGKQATVNVPPEKKREVTTAFARYRGQAVANVNVQTKVGVAIPRTVTLVEVPQDIVVIVPEYRRYKYFVVQGVVCIVDPNTYVVVDVIHLT